MYETTERYQEGEGRLGVEMLEPPERGGMVLVAGTIVTAIAVAVFLCGVWVGRAMGCG